MSLPPTPTPALMAIASTGLPMAYKLSTFTILRKQLCDRVFLVKDNNCIFKSH
ncbi:hypothetical protein [Nostoc sp. NMS8]|uniref:hypothetical protein n=1 Tax=Nostoc sp. NMS8 TaxID=2815392 RepID=UPI0025EFCE21|nr:hypothetical protein [Nostoc sp. NMS8]MBN3958860.1 hypothetical protein [Nostoc sp. NMS8]